MPSNAYEQPDFAAAYVSAEIDLGRNRYEWEVTMGALRQFIEPGMRMIDYGCGGGAFTATMAELVGPHGSCVGTDASTEMLRHAESYADGPCISFEQWDACQTDSPLQDGTADLVFAKLALNYVRSSDLYGRLLPRLRACLKDTGLLVAVLPNPFSETDYDLAAYSDVEQVPIQVGGFGEQLTTTAYHHPIERILSRSYNAGFAFASVLTLPKVYFDPGRQATPDFEVLNLPLADDMPDELLENRRLLYIFGAGLASFNTFAAASERHRNWLHNAFPR